MRGPGTLDVESGISIEGLPIGFPQAAGWTAGTNPDRVVIFLNNRSRTLTLIKITAVLEQINTDPGSLNIFYAPGGSIISNSTSQVSTIPLNLQATLGPGTTMFEGSYPVPQGGRIGIRVTSPGPANWDCIGTIVCFFV
jgi:hypothetical protein